MSHREPAPESSPISSPENRPVFTSDDFPVPDEPSTARNRRAANLAIIWSTH